MTEKGRKIGDGQVVPLPSGQGAAAPPPPKKRVELPVLPAAGYAGVHRGTGADVRPHATARPDGKTSLIALRQFAKEAEGGFSYNMGRIDIYPNGKVGFLDLTMEQVPLAQMMSRDPAQQARLAEFRVDWPGGVDQVHRDASYVALAKSGELDRRLEKLREIKAKDAYGVYKRSGDLKIGGWNLNVGEEKEISGTGGSGTVYFSGCSMKCVFCQYADIAHMKSGGEVKTDDLSEIFLELQNRGAHNIQLMTPSHYAVEIVEALKEAAEKGLKIPLVWNTGGYEDLDALKQLEGIVDVYLPDVKFGNNEAGAKYGGTQGYWDNVQEAVREMHRQVGDVKTDDRGVAYQGVLVRHLVMPGDVADAEPIAKLLASISKDMQVDLMPQWRPDFAVAVKFEEINRAVTPAEYEATRQKFLAAGLHVGLDRTQQEQGV